MIQILNNSGFILKKLPEIEAYLAYFVKKKYSNYLSQPKIGDTWEKLANLR